MSGQPPASLVFFGKLPCSSARSARFWLVLLACLVQLWVPARYRHAPATTPYAIAHAIKDYGSTIVNVDAEKPSFPCPLHSTPPNSHHGNSSPPCNNGDCPFCPCPGCAPMHAAMGILSQEAAQADYAPLISAFAPPP